MDINYTQLNKDFRFVYTPNYEFSDNKEWFNKLSYNFKISYNSKRFLISANSIKYYLGYPNEKKVILATEKMKTDKKTIKFRNYGKIEIYVK